jgi:hypothetical protein
VGRHIELPPTKRCIFVSDFIRGAYWWSDERAAPEADARLWRNDGGGQPRKKTFGGEIMRKKVQKVVITQDEEVVEVPILAKAIVEISASMKKLLASGINRRGIVCLLADSVSYKESYTYKKMSKGQIGGTVTVCREWPVAPISASVIL